MSDPIGGIASSLIEKAIERGIPEVHLEPLAEKLAVRYQVGDRLHEELFLPKLVHPALVDRYRKLQRPNLLTRLNPGKRHYAIWDEEKEHDLYITFLPTPLGEKVVMKIIPAGWLIWSLQKKAATRLTAPATGRTTVGPPVLTRRGTMP